MTIVFKPEAEQDVSDASAWYRSRRAGLDVEFIKALDAALAIIGRKPELHRKVRGNFRRALVSRFPCAIYYLTDGQFVTVYCVMHQRRAPAAWSARLVE